MMNTYNEACVKLAALQAATVTVGTAEEKAAKKSHGESVAAQVRANAKLAVELEIDAPEAAKRYAAFATVAKVPQGTVKAYGAALKGYIVALERDESIETGFGKKGDKPMPAATAQAVWTDSQLDGETRVLNAAIATLIERAKACTDLAAIMAASEALPEVSQEVTVKAETAAEKRKREAAELIAAFQAEAEESEAEAEAEESEAEPEAARSGTNG